MVRLRRLRMVAPWSFGAATGWSRNFRSDRHQRKTREAERGTTEAGYLVGYTLIFRSNKPDRSKFRRWVTREVPPQIRRTGSYAAKPLAHVFVRRLNDNWDRTDRGYFSVMSVWPV